MIERLIVFAFTQDEVANMDDYPFHALIDKKIARGDYKEIRSVEELLAHVPPQAIGQATVGNLADRFRQQEQDSA